MSSSRHLAQGIPPEGTERTRRCSRCRARLPRDATWCSLCLTPTAAVVDDRPAASDLAAPRRTRMPVQVAVPPADDAITTAIDRRADVEPVDDRLADVPWDAWFDRLRAEQPPVARGWAAQVTAAPRAVVVGVGLLVVALTSMAFFAVVGLLLGT